MLKRLYLTYRLEPYVLKLIDRLYDICNLHHYSIRCEYLDSDRIQLELAYKDFDSHVEHILKELRNYAY